jgi:hypothetical protein
MTALALMIIAITATGFAQGPTQKEVVLTVNLPHQLRMGDYMLSAGTYTIYQVSQHDPNLFYLYKGVMKTHSPIAAIRTLESNTRRMVTPARPICDGKSMRRAARRASRLLPDGIFPVRTAGKSYRLWLTI